jgi:NAD(P)H-flavin reductase
MNVYQPWRVRVEERIDETPDTRTLRLRFLDEEVARDFHFRAGQFGEYSVFGEGECTFCIASSPTRKGYIECSFKTVGKVTTAMKDLEVGDEMGFRGPYGNHFPLERMEGGNIVFIAGGIGLAPVRCVLAPAGISGSPSVSFPAHSVTTRAAAMTSGGKCCTA